MSAFDMFDSFKPDLFISHFQFVNDDCMKYLSQNKHTASSKLHWCNYRAIEGYRI